jgi:PKD repeat protein
MFFLIIILSALVTTGFAQEARGYCGTDAYDEFLKEHIVGYAQDRLNSDQEWINRKEHSLKMQAPLKKFIFPVVVHVIHSGAGAPDSISKAQVISQFEVLNNDFRNIPGTLRYGNGVDTGIEFELATKDTAGNPTDGIIYYNDPTLAVFDRNTEETQLKQSYSWNRRRYLNIWLVREIANGGTAGTTLAYAFFPTTTASFRDGIVCRADCWGTAEIVPRSAGGIYYTTPYSFGGVAAHEIGHWLNLYHPFQGGCGSNCRTTGDLICDTPPTKEENFGSGNNRQNSCMNDSPDLPDNPRNIMDYLSDQYKNFFTPQQLSRMVTAIENTRFVQRYPLWQETNHRLTGIGKYGIPKAKFSAKSQYTFSGSEIQFIDFSRNMPEDADCEYFWQFEGGNPATSTEREPKIRYDSAGSFGVTLIVKNLAGTDTLYRPDFIQITDQTVTLPITESFESGTFPPSGWRIDNPDSANPAISKTWNLSSAALGVGAFGLSAVSARMTCNNYADYGQKDALVLPAIDLKGEKSGYIAFSVAYSPLRSGLLYTDTLIVAGSTDGGNTWKEIYRKGGETLMTTASPQTFAGFLPFNDQWRRDSVRLETLEVNGNEKLLIKFEIINGFGNTFYLDDIMIDKDRITHILKQHILVTGLRLYPNPIVSGNELVAELNLSGATDAEWTITNIMGQKISAGNWKLDSGLNKQNLNISAPAGVYILHVILENTTVATRFLVK